MTEVECPVDGCEYQDAVRSVKAHITASTDDKHDGMHGMDAADSLREQANSRVNGEVPRLDDAVDEARDAVADAADGILTRPGSGPDDPAEPEQADAGPEPDDEPDDASPEPDDEPAVEPVEEIKTGADGEGEFGIPVPVDANYIVIGTALLVVVLLFRSGSGSNNSSETDDDDAPTDGIVVQSGGQMTTAHTFQHEIQWHWVIAGIAVVAVVWELSDSSLAEDASKEDAARVASQLMTN